MAGKGWQLDVSYRGVPFFVENAEDEYARRGAHHQYPQRGKGVFEDLGQDDTVYNLSGYVTELSPGGYAAARDKLIDACTAGGLGNLVHPYLGTKKVQCTACRMAHNDKENGVARFTLSFIEADEPAPPAEAFDPAAQINEAADAALEAALEDFAYNWSLAGLPGFVSDAAVSLTDSVAAAFTELAGPLPGLMGDTSKFIAGTAKLLGVAAEALDYPKAFFLRQVNGLTGGLSGDALTLGRQIAGLGRMLSILSGSEKEGYNTQQAFKSTGASGPAWAEVPEYTENRKAQARNQAALGNLIERGAVIDAARMTPYLPFDSREEAVAVRDTLGEQLDALADAAPDALYQRLEVLRAAVLADITRRGPKLGSVGSYMPLSTRPALVVAYELYRDIGPGAELATELAARNQLAHPGFVPGGQVLEVKLNA